MCTNVLFLDEKIKAIWFFFFFAREEYLAKIERRIKEYKISVLNEPREGKKLLVLDIDYTLFGMYQLSLWKGTVNVQCT